MSLIEQYFNVYKEKINEYGEKCVVLMQVGSFYECYELDNENEKIGNAYILSKKLNMTYANKKGDIKNNSKTYPNFIGFTTTILNKYLSILLENGYTVIIMDQVGKNEKNKLMNREITKIYSPALQPLNILEKNENNLVSIICEINEKKSNKKNGKNIQELKISICNVNNINNTIEIIEKEMKIEMLKLTLETITNMLYKYDPKEILLYFVKNNDLNNKIKQYFIENYENVHLRKIKEEHYNKEYQNMYLKEIYKNISFGLIEPIEYINLNEMSIINLLNVLNFIEIHDKRYLENISLPNKLIQKNNLTLELNTVVQLNIVNNEIKNKSIFNIINFTRTKIGERYLRSLLCNPLNDPKIINNRYNISERIHCFDEILMKILDIEKLHRKMGVNEIDQDEYVNLCQCYENILFLLKKIENDEKLKEFLKIELEEIDLLEFENYINKIKKIFNFEIMKKYKLNTSKDELENYFNKGVINDLDKIQKEINKLEQEREKIRLKYNCMLGNVSDLVKLSYTELEGYSFNCTKNRFEILKKKLPENIRKKVTNNIVKFFPEELENLSNDIIELRDKLLKNVTEHYKRIINENYNAELFNKLKKHIELLDICNSNIRCKLKNNYSRPDLIETDESIVEIESIRHPIIENLGKEYIQNDIELSSNCKGMLVYGLNSSGKSSLLRAIGINVIMAQCGLYVPCKKMRLSPFKTMISQVDLTDNIFSGKSSFITEMIGLKRILEVSDKNTLILCDEMCKGTESKSSISLVTATLLELIKRNSKFFFTSHLHEICEIEQIKKNKEIKINHLSIIIKNNNIIYERKLKEGCGSELYGLEVAKNILNNFELIENAYEIRNKITNNSTIKKSNYNKKKIMKKCEICGDNKNLETDHIIEQKLSNEDGFLENGLNKNHLSNLCTLCKECHLKKTYGKIKINGYKETINGKILDFLVN